MSGPAAAGGADTDDPTDDTLGALAAQLAAANRTRRDAYVQQMNRAARNTAAVPASQRRRQVRAQPPVGHGAAGAAAAPAAPPLPAALQPPADPEAGSEDELMDDDMDVEELEDGDALLYGELSEDEEAYEMAAADEARLQREESPFDLDDPEDACAAEDHDPHACYACRHSGERRPGQNMAALERLITNAQEGLMTSDWNEHFRAVSREYERNIREPANKRRKKGELPLPMWGPSQVRRHLLHDSFDPVVRQMRTIRELDQLGTVLIQEDLVRRRRNARRPDGQMRRTLDDKAVDKLCKLKRLQLEWERYDARKSAFYNPDRHFSTRNLPNPVVDTTHKNLYTDEYHGQNIEKYFKKRKEVMNAAASAAASNARR